MIEETEDCNLSYKETLIAESLLTERFRGFLFGESKTVGESTHIEVGLQYKMAPAQHFYDPEGDWETKSIGFAVGFVPPLDLTEKQIVARYLARRFENLSDCGFGVRFEVLAQLFKDVEATEKSAAGTLVVLKFPYHLAFKEAADQPIRNLLSDIESWQSDKRSPACAKITRRRRSEHTAES